MQQIIKFSLGTDNPPTNIVDMMDVGAALSYDYAGLTYGTTYYWSVTPYNTNGDAVGCPVWSFTTRANPIISAYPYSEDFETGAMPLNWVDTAKSRCLVLRNFNIFSGNRTTKR